jgi:hypothetical protein
VAAAVEPRARPPASTAPAWPGAKPPPSGDASKSGEVRSVGDKPNAASSVKAPAKVDDPFADLDSLEAEMARLLGREK